MYSFPNLEPVCCSMSISNCCLLTCIQISQDVGKVVWYSHLLKNFPQFVVIYRVKGFGIINKAELDIFLELSCFFYDPTGDGNLICGSSAFSKSSLNIWKFKVHILLKPGLENFEHYFASVWDECNCAVVWTSFGTADLFKIVLLCILVCTSSSASVRSKPSLSFIVPIFANVLLVFLVFLKSSLVSPILLFSSISLYLSLRKATNPIKLGLHPYYISNYNYFLKALSPNTVTFGDQGFNIWMLEEGHISVGALYI